LDYVHDYHKVGLNQDFLASFLAQAGYVDVCRVPSFGLFNDTSEMKFRGVPIRLNIIATARPQSTGVAARGD
jgi:hypothetical protein